MMTWMLKDILPVLFYKSKNRNRELLFHLLILLEQKYIACRPLSHDDILRRYGLTQPLCNIQLVKRDPNVYFRSS
jgi:hypothetical protein